MRLQRGGKECRRWMDGWLVLPLGDASWRRSGVKFQLENDGRESYECKGAGNEPGWSSRTRKMGSGEPEALVGWYCGGWSDMRVAYSSSSTRDRESEATMDYNSFPNM